MDAPTENTPKGGGQGERPLTKSRWEEDGEAAAALTLVPGTTDPALTLDSLPSGILHQILLQLEEPADLGRAACVNQLLNRAVAPLAPALFFYAQEGETARVKELLGRPSVLAGIGAAHTESRITALHAAAGSGHTEIVSALVKAGAPIDARSLHESTPIMLSAIWPSHPEVANLLRAAGAVVEAGSAFWAKRLQDAASGGDYQSVELVLSLGVPPEAASAAGSWTPLMIAAAKGRDDIAQALLDSGADIHYVDADGATALHLACGFGEDEEENYYTDDFTDYEETMATLLEAGGDVNAVTENGATPLIVAAEYGRAAVVERLLEEEGVVINASVAPSCGSFTALMMAAARGRCDIVAMLVEAGADVNLRGTEGVTALLAACGGFELPFDDEAEYAGVVDLLLESGAELGLHLEGGRTPLIVAAAAGRADVVGRLLAEEVDVNASAARCSGETALMAAAKLGWNSIVELLITAGASVNFATSDKETALFKALGPINNAIGADNPAVVRRLLAAGADVGACLDLGISSLMKAACNGRLDGMEELVKSGADINAASADGSTTLMLACECGSLPMVSWLLAHGAEVNASAAGRDGITALGVAAFNGWGSLVEALIRHGANTNCAQSHGVTPLMKAMLQDNTADAADYPAVIRHLLAAGADPLAVDERGGSCLIWAAMFGRLHAVEALIQAGADVHVVDSSGRDALAYASLEHPDVAAALRAAGAVDYSESDDYDYLCS